MNKSNADASLIREIAALRELTVGQLRARYLELFGEETKTRNKEFLFKRIAYRLQEKKYGGLTDRARAHAQALAEDAPIRRKLPSGTTTEGLMPRDQRLPPTGSVLKRTFAGVEHAVTVLDDGFEHQGERFKTLSQVAKRITGTQWNGFGFFGLLKKDAA